MQKYSNILLIVLAIAGGIMLYQQNRQLTLQLATMQARMSAVMQQPRSGGDGKQEEDPYIAGAVKNAILKQLKFHHFSCQRIKQPFGEGR